MSGKPTIRVLGAGGDYEDWPNPNYKEQSELSATPLLDSASAIDELDEWRIACNWKATNPDWDATIKIVIAFAREGKRLAALSNGPDQRPAK